MAQRVVGGGERFVGSRTISFAALADVSRFEVIVPPGADSARIQPQFMTNLDYLLAIRRAVIGTTGAYDTVYPSLAANEMLLASMDIGMDAFPAGTKIRGVLLDDLNYAEADGGAKDYVTIAFYTNIAGRGAKAGV